MSSKGGFLSINMSQKYYFTIINIFETNSFIDWTVEKSDYVLEAFSTVFYVTYYII